MLLFNSEYPEVLAYMMMVSPGLGLVDTETGPLALLESALLSFDKDIVDKGKSTITHSDTAPHNHGGQNHRSQPTSRKVRDLRTKFESEHSGTPKTQISLTSGVADSGSGFSTKAEDALWYSSLYIMSSSWLILILFKPSLSLALLIFGVPYVFS